MREEGRSRGTDPPLASGSGCRASGSVPTTGEDHDVVEERHDRLHGGRDVGQRRRAEDGRDPAPLLVIPEEASLPQGDLGPTRGIELDRQGDQLEEDDEGEEDDPREEQRLHGEENPSDQEEDSEAAAEVREGHRGSAHVERRVIPRVLDRMSRLVGRDRGGGDAAAGVVPLAQAEDPAAGVVVVGQPTGDPLDPHTVDTPVAKDRFGDVDTPTPARQGHPRPARHGALDPHLRKDGEEDRRAHHDEVTGIEEDHRKGGSDGGLRRQGAEQDHDGDSFLEPKWGPPPFGARIVHRPPGGAPGSPRFSADPEEEGLRGDRGSGYLDM
jgi:hypothetical protein